MKQLNPVLHFILEQRYILNNLSEQVGTALGAAEAAATRSLRIRPGTLGELGAEESVISKLRRQKQGSPYEIPQIDSGLSKLIDELNLISKENLWASKQGQIVETELKNAIEEALSKGKQNALDISLEVAKTKPDLFKSVHSATIVDKLNTMTLKRVGEVEAKNAPPKTPPEIIPPTRIPSEPPPETEQPIRIPQPKPIEPPTEIPVPQPEIVPPTQKPGTGIPTQIPFEFPPDEKSESIDTPESLTPDEIGALSLFPSFAFSLLGKLGRKQNPSEDEELQRQPQPSKFRTKLKTAIATDELIPQESEEEYEYIIKKKKKKKKKQDMEEMESDILDTEAGLELDKILGKYSGTQRIK